MCFRDEGGGRFHELREKDMPACGNGFQPKAKVYDAREESRRAKRRKGAGV